MPCTEATFTLHRLRRAWTALDAVMGFLALFDVFLDIVAYLCVAIGSSFDKNNYKSCSFVCYYVCTVFITNTTIRTCTYLVWYLWAARLLPTPIASSRIIHDRIWRGGHLCWCACLPWCYRPCFRPSCGCRCVLMCDLFCQFWIRSINFSMFFPQSFRFDCLDNMFTCLGLDPNFEASYCPRPDRYITQKISATPSIINIQKLPVMQKLPGSSDSLPTYHFCVAFTMSHTCI